MRLLRGVVEVRMRVGLLVMESDNQWTSRVPFYVATTAVSERCVVTGSAQLLKHKGERLRRSLKDH